MIVLVCEDGNSLLKGKKFFIPDKIKKYLKNLYRNYNGDKQAIGYKRLKNLIDSNGIYYNEMKRLKNFFDNYNGNETDVEFELNGGVPMRSWVNMTLYNATKTIEDFKREKMNAGFKNSFIKPHTKERKAKPTKIKMNISSNPSKNIYNNNMFKFESVLNENNERFYEYMEEYNVEYVLSEFFKDRKGKQKWTPIINPNMYKKALDEFVKYGRFINFPTNYIYKWFGIIMKNTAILMANNELSGHDTFYPYEEVEYALNNFYDDDKEYVVDDDNVIFDIDYNFFSTFAQALLTRDDYYELSNIINDIVEAVHKSGPNKGQYELFMSQEELDDYDKNSFENIKNSKLYDAISFFNKKSHLANIFSENGILKVKCELYLYLEYLGLFDWMVFPDGSQGFTDFGLEPILKIINTYNNNMSPEETIVLLNKVLDVYHSRGDLSSIFIDGGSKTLSQISN